MTVINNQHRIREGVSLFQAGLSPFSRLYGAAAHWRRALYAANILKPKQLSCPVISIGNLTTGGTGKTPMTVYIASILTDAGLSPLILSRGYRGSASGKGGLVSDGRNILMDAACSGDEPLLMAERLTSVPVAVGQDRYQVATGLLDQFSPDVILLDDGFQHFQLARDIDIVLLDNARPLGNGRLLPAGPLREPLNALEAADIIIFTRADNAGEPHPGCLEKHITGKPRFYASHVPFIAAWIAGGTQSEQIEQTPVTDALAKRRAYVFCGLADNRTFLAGVRRLVPDIAGYRFFRDHHAYTSDDLGAIARAAREYKADTLITSAKDYVKFRNRSLPDLPCDLVVMDVAISFKDQAERFDALLRSRLEKRC